MLRSLPSVEQVLQSANAALWRRRLARETVADLVREAVATVRKQVLEGSLETRSGITDEVVTRVETAVGRLCGQSLRRVINASGVILHTNLGRAPMSSAARNAVTALAGGYTNLEYDLATGRRGKRDVHCGHLLESLLGVPALVVNNNAAAIFLVMHELARDGEVIISRGELVEIGDGFRIPDILEASGATLREVGTTNRTRLADYGNAIGPATRALLRVHPSNFRQLGFTGMPSLEKLAELADSSSIPLVEDLGSGCLVDLRRVGIDGEPRVSDSIRAGVGLVTFSGDKLLGGPQAGIIAGRPELIRRIRRNPVFRALRVDKLILAALGATLRHYLADRAEDIPAIRLMMSPLGEVEARAKEFAARLNRHGVRRADVIPSESLLGGGSTPLRSLPSAVVAISPPEGTTSSQMQARLRCADPPVVARVANDRVVLDLRTVLEDEQEDLLEAVVSAAQVSG